MTAFEKSTRRKLFYTMVGLFAVLIPLILLYSRGYTIDFQNRGLVPTGGVFIKVIQPDAKVLVNSEFSRETSFIAHGALLTGLLPKRYAIRVEKDGRQSWEKAVRVVDSEVLEFRNVFLPPATITPTVLYNARRTPVSLFALTGRQEVAIETGRTEGPTSVFVVHPETRTARINFARVADWLWDPASKNFVISRSGDGSTSWSRLPIDGGGEIPFVFRGLPPGFSADRVLLHPTISGEFYFLAGGGLFRQSRASVPLPIAEGVHAFAVTRDHIYYLTLTGFFVETNLDGGDAKILGREGLFLDKEAPARIIPSPAGDIAVIDSAGGLFVYHPGEDPLLSYVTGNVGGVDFSANGDRMLFWEDTRLWLYWFQDNPGQPFDLARTRRQFYVAESAVKQAFLNVEGTHAFFSTAEGLHMVEADDRGSANHYELVSAPIETFALDAENLMLYWTDGARVLWINLR